MSEKKLHPWHGIVRLISLIVIFVCIIIAATQINYSAIVDNISSIGYEMSPELADIVDDIKLTRDGERILMATRPELQEAEEFNQNCVSGDSESATLGCYSNNRIFIYNIVRSELEGIRQVTLAHELLHAVWARMTDSERRELHDSLDSIYQTEESIREHMKLYSPDGYYDELHSTIGSQISPDKLSEPLRNHYAKYFTNQSKLAEFYDGYNAQFKVASDRIKELEKEIAERKDAVIKKQEEYMLNNSILSNDINDFNARARNGSFESVEQFHQEREALIQRQSVQRAAYQEIMNYISDTNALVNEYNNNIARKTSLYKSIDSKIDQPDDTTEE